MKRCFKCGEVKDLSDFHRNRRMADGHLNKCKSCARLDAAQHRAKNIDAIRAYDRARGGRQTNEDIRRYRSKYPIKYRAHNLVNNSIRDGKLFPMPCEICGAKADAHHDDYAKPLNVRWLCRVHHKEWHREHGEGLNAGNIPA